MQIGKLRHRIAIQEATVTQSDTGYAVKTWSTVTTVWGRIEPLSGREALIAQQISPELSHKVTLRYYPDLTPEHRIKFNDRYFDVNFIRNLEEKNRVIIVLCKEAV